MSLLKNDSKGTEYKQKFISPTPKKKHSPRRALFIGNSITLRPAKLKKKPDYKKILKTERLLKCISAISFNSPALSLSLSL